MDKTLKEVILANKGKFFTVDFVKKSGEKRTINGAVRMVEGYPGQNTVAHLPQYVTVVLSKKDDKGRPQFRNVNVNTIRRLAIGGRVYYNKGEYNASGV